MSIYIDCLLTKKHKFLLPKNENGNDGVLNKCGKSKSSFPFMESE